MDDLPNPMTMIAGLAILSLVPFVAVMATSFVKLAIVFSLLRNALGVQQIPPNIALYGLAIILTCYIMAPVGFEIYDYVQKHEVALEDSESVTGLINEGLTPYREFLKRNASPEEQKFFIDSTKKLWPAKYAQRVDGDSLLVLLPAFTVSELTRAFEIGFLIYLPFLVIDLIISNVLLAMGMMMVSPMTISLPLKLLLFVLLDGWTRLTHGLITTYS